MNDSPVRFKTSHLLSQDHVLEYSPDQREGIKRDVLFRMFTSVWFKRQTDRQREERERERVNQNM